MFHAVPCLDFPWTNGRSFNMDTVQWVNFWFTLTRRSDIVAMLLAQAGSLESLGTCQVFWHRFS